MVCLPISPLPHKRPDGSHTVFQAERRGLISIAKRERRGQARDVAEGLKRLLKKLEKQIPRRLKPAGDDNGKGLVGMTEVTP